MPVPLAVPVAVTVTALRPEPGPARAWLRRELSRPEYHRSLLERFFGWVGDVWDALRGAALDATPLSTAAAVVVVVLLLVVVGLLVSRVRREPVSPLDGDPVVVTGSGTPEEHRARAEAALAAGAVDRAIVEAFRALALRAVARGVLEDRPGLTAHELARDLQPAFPEQAEQLRRAAQLFDLVFYGDQPAAAGDARAVLDLDDTLRTTRPARGRTTAGSPPHQAVPR